MYVKTIDNLLSQYPYNLHQLKQEYPNTSFPKVMSETFLAMYGIYFVVQELIEYEEDTERVEDGNVELLNGVWTQRKTVVLLPLPTPEEKKQLVTALVQTLLDEYAQNSGWDDMESARACAGIPLFGDESQMELDMHADSVTLARWYLKMWGHTYQVENDVKAGIRQEPTIEAFLGELPTPTK